MAESTTNFNDWIKEIYQPSCIVFSTKNAKSILSTNNLTPSQFLRPFGDFNGMTINFIVTDKYTVSLKNFKIDFYDSETYKRVSNNVANDSYEILLARNAPEWNLEKEALMQKNYEFIKQNLKNMSFDWYNEYEKTFFEASYFNELEYFQQPFCNIFICSIKDKLEEIEFLKSKECQPLLYQENVYETRMPTMIIILSDLKDEKVPNDFVFRFVESVKKNNLNAFVQFFEINSSILNISNDIWSNYLHRLEIYNKNHISNIERGQFISSDERDTLKMLIFKFFNDYVKPFLQNLVSAFDEDINKTKKGFKNTVFSIFKNPEKIEYITSLGIYKLTNIEKKMYLLSLIQFYFKDYENCYDNLSILASDLKEKSNEYHNTLQELIAICRIMLNKKDPDFDNIYTAYYKSKNSKNCVRFVLVYIRYLEGKRRFNEIPKLILKVINDNLIPYLNALFYEKASIYYIYGQISLRKFVTMQFLAGSAYKNQNIDLKKYSLNCFGLIHKFFENSVGWSRMIEYLTTNIGELCFNQQNYVGSLKFFKNCLEFSKFKTSDNDQINYLKNFLNSLSKVHDKNSIFNLNNVGYLSIPEIVEDSIIIYDEEDTKLINYGNWSGFKKYTKISRETAVVLNEYDVFLLNNLDSIYHEKQKFSKKNLLKFNTGTKIIVRVKILNPLNIALNITSLELVCSYIGNKVFEGKNFEYGGFSRELEKKSLTTILLYFIPKEAGKVRLDGLSIGLYKMALFSYSFNHRSEREYKHKEERVRDELVEFNILNDHQKIDFTLSTNQVFLYQYQLLILTAKIRNNTAHNFKRFTLYFDNQNIFLTNYINFDIELPKNEEIEVKFLVYSEDKGDFACKVLLKVEEETKQRDFEIKKAILLVRVYPSIIIHFKEEILSFSKEKVVFTVNSRFSHIDQSDVGLFALENIYSNKNYQLLDRNTSLETLDPSHNTDYIVLKFSKFNDIKKENEIENFSFIQNEDKHIKTIFNEVIKKNNIILSWTTKNLTTNQTIVGLSFYKPKFKNPKINFSYLKSMYKNSLFTEIIVHGDLDYLEKIYTLIEIKFRIQNIIESGELKSYEICVSDEDNEYIWLGNRKIKISETRENFTTSFFALTDKKGFLDLNKFTTTLFPKNDSDKATVFKQIPHSIMVELK